MIRLFKFVLLSVLFLLPRKALAFGLDFGSPLEFFVTIVLGFSVISVPVGIITSYLVHRSYMKKHPGRRFFLQAFAIFLAIVIGSPWILVFLLG